MAKGSAKKPKESKCRGSSAPLEGRDWVRIGGNKWLREVAEKQGKFISKEYRGKNGVQFDQERALRQAEAEKAALVIVHKEAREDLESDSGAKGAENSEADYVDATYGESALVAEA